MRPSRLVDIGQETLCFACDSRYTFTVDSGGLCPECNDADHARCIRYGIECDCEKCERRR